MHTTTKLAAGVVAAAAAAAVAGLAGALPANAAPGNSADPALATSDQFTPVAPTRLVDTRDNTGGLNSGAIPANTAKTFTIPRSLSQTATAFVFNVTAVDPTGPGNLRIAAHCSSTIPTNNTSLVNFQPGEPVANDIVVSNQCPTGLANAFDVYDAGSPTNVLVDLQGYYTTTDGFIGGTPQRSTTSPVSVAADGTAAIKVAAAATTETPLALNVTAVGPTGPGNLAVFGAGASAENPPEISNINYITGVDKAAFVVVTPNTDGTIFVRSSGSAAGVLVDNFGTFPSTSTTKNITPFRAIDTRTGDSSVQDGTSVTVPVTGDSGVPAGAAAVIVSLTGIHVADESTGVGNLRAYPSGAGAPTVSNLNYVSPVDDVANLAYVPVASDGTIQVATFGSNIDVAVDILGYVPAS